MSLFHRGTWPVTGCKYHEEVWPEHKEFTEAVGIFNPSQDVA